MKGIRTARDLLKRTAGLLDSLDMIIYALLTLLGFGALAYVGYVALTG